MRNTSAWWVALVAVAGLVLAGCPSQTSGDDDDDAISDDDAIGDDDGGDDDGGDGWQTLFEDDFERPDGPLGGDLEALCWLGSEILEIRSGEVFVDCEFFAIRWIDSIPDETIRISADIRYEVSGAEGVQVAVVARYAEDLNGDYPSYDAFVDGGADEVALMRSLVSGVDGQLEVVSSETLASPLDPDTVYRVVLTVDGGELAGDFTDVAAGTTESLTLSDSAPLDGGQAGIHGQITGDVVVTLDDLLIERYVP